MAVTSLASVSGLRAVGERKNGLRRHGIALEAEARRAAHGVRARRRDRVVDHPGGLAELRREAVGDDLDLADEHLGDRQHAEAGAILLGVRVAIDLIVRVHLRSVGVDARHAELVVLVAGDVRLQEREVVGIARDQRQVPDFGLADGAAEIDLARLRDRRLAGDGDRFRHVADAERDVDDGRLAGREREPLLLELLEALQLARRRDSGRAGAAVRDRRPPRCVTTTRVSPVSRFVTVTLTPGSARAGLVIDGAFDACR